MTIEIRVPQLPESVADATLVAWRKQPGETASRDENLADLETDKVVLEVPAPAAGVLKELRVQAGATVKSGDLIAIFEEGAAAAAPAKAAKPATKESAKAAAKESAKEPAKEAAKLGPAARRVVEEHGVDPSTVAGSGRDGRVTKGDFDTSRGREIFAEVLASGRAVADVVASLGIAAVGDDELVALCRELIAENPKIVADVKGGKEQAAAGLIGQAKKKNANVNPGKVRAMCLELIRGM